MHGDRSSGDHRPERLLGPGEVHTLPRGDGPSSQHTHVPPAPVPGGREFRAIGLRTSVWKRGQGNGSERRLPGTGAGQTLGRRSGQDLLHGRGERPFEGGVERRFTHFDTTSFSLYGEYPEKGKNRTTGGGGEETGPSEAAASASKDRQPVKPKQGHSKDHRPDLKQILFKLFVNREGIPLFGEVRDGTLPDKTATGEMLAEICRLFAPVELKKTVYVADSALITGANLEAMRERSILFLSRLPEAYGACAKAKQNAFGKEGEWVEIGRVSERGSSADFFPIFGGG